MVVDGVSGDARQPAPPPYFFDGQGQNGNGDDKFTGLGFSSDQELQLYKRLAEKSFHDMQMKYSYHQVFLFGFLSFSFVFVGFSLAFVF